MAVSKVASKGELSKTTNASSRKKQPRSLALIKTKAAGENEVIQEHGYNVKMFKPVHLQDVPDEEQSSIDSQDIKQAWKRAEKQNKIDSFIMQ